VPRSLVGGSSGGGGGGVGGKLLTSVTGVTSGAPSVPEALPALAAPVPVAVPVAVPGDESMAGTPGSEEDLKAIVRRVQEFRFDAALAARLPALPPIAPGVLCSLGAQMGLPVQQVARAFATAQAHLDAKIARLRSVARERRAQQQLHA
jgi:hypothetical protein